MTLYVGETVLIKHSATLDDKPLTAADVNSVTITIYSPTGTIVDPQTPMIWDAPNVRWLHSWDTSPGLIPGGTFLSPGRYLVKVYILSNDLAENWEYTHVRLKVNPI